jgi:hypothetical protein
MEFAKRPSDTGIWYRDEQSERDHVILHQKNMSGNVEYTVSVRYPKGVAEPAIIRHLKERSFLADENYVPPRIEENGGPA